MKVAIACSRVGWVMAAAIRALSSEGGGLLGGVGRKSKFLQKI
ncbi:MAG TPA: hypothetical protein VF081_07580 [Solirubrobacterales bacterium]